MPRCFALSFFLAKNGLFSFLKSFIAIFNHGLNGREKPLNRPKLMDIAQVRS